MPPKVTDTQPAPEQNTVEKETARAARRVVATYAEDFLDGVTLMSMLGVEPEGLVHKKVLAEHEDSEAEPKKSTKKTGKKTTKKATKKSSKKTTKKAAKKSTKKTTKKSTKKTTKKSTKSTAKKSTKKTTKKSE